jgi:hypothetical protein
MRTKMNNVIRFPRGFRYPGEHTPEVPSVTPEIDTIEFEVDTEIPSVAEEMGATPVGGKALAYRAVNLFRLIKQQGTTEAQRNKFRCAAANAIFQGLRLKRTDPVEYMLYKATFEALCERHFGKQAVQRVVSDSVDV